MLSILATIFFSAVVLAASGVLLASLDEAREFFLTGCEMVPARPESRRRAVSIRRPAQLAQTPLRAAA